MLQIISYKWHMDECCLFWKKLSQRLHLLIMMMLGKANSQRTFAIWLASFRLILCVLTQILKTRVSYIICRAKWKIKIQSLLFKNEEENSINNRYENIKLFSFYLVSSVFKNLWLILSKTFENLNQHELKFAFLFIFYNVHFKRKYTSV